MQGETAARHREDALDAATGALSGRAAWTAGTSLSVGALVEEVGLSQSALSQHLARLREDGLVAYRRDAQSLHYRIADPDVVRVLAVLRDIYCPELSPASRGQA